MNATWTARARREAARLLGLAVVPLLAGYLYVGSCSNGAGFVVAFRGWGVSASAAWCPG
jgi:hypothetical protein